MESKHILLYIIYVQLFKIKYNNIKIEHYKLSTI